MRVHEDERERKLMESSSIKDAESFVSVSKREGKKDTHTFI